MNELLWTLFVMAFGAAFGWSVRDYLAEKMAKQQHTEHLGLYGDPNLAYWYRMRLNETDPYWCRMPLREYADKKRLAMYGNEN